MSLFTRLFKDAGSTKPKILHMSLLRDKQSINKCLWSCIKKYILCPESSETECIADIPRHSWPILCQTVNQNIHQDLPQRFRDIIRRRSTWVVVKREVVLCTRQFVAAYGIIHQRIFASTSNNCIASCPIFSRFVILRFSLIPTTARGIERPSLCWHSTHSDSHDKTAVAFQRVLFKTAFITSRNAGSGALMQVEAISKDILTTRV